MIKNYLFMKKLIYFVAVLLVLGCSKKDEKPVVDLPVDTISDEPFQNVPKVEDMVVYEIDLPVFSSTGDLDGATARLDSIKNLGVNVVWLMPIYPIGVLKAAGSPYCVQDYTSVNPSFGSLGSLQEFVSQAHKRNMAVILDWVADHTSWDNNWISDKSWYKQDASGNIISPVGTNWTDVAQLNYSSKPMRLAMIDAMTYWVTQANVDGFRCDAVDYVTSDFWKQAIDSLKQMKDRTLIMLAEGGNSSNFQVGFQMNYAWDFNTALINIFNKGVASSIFSVENTEYSVVPAGDQKLRYITNHDVDYSNSLIADYVSDKGSLAAFVITAFLRGVPLIYNGQEVAYPYRINFFQNVTATPITWDLNPSIYKAYKNIMQVRNSLTSVKKGSITEFDDNDIVAFERIYQNENILVLVNVRSTSSNFTVPQALVNTAWTNLMDNSSVTLSSNLSLGAFSFMILKK
jgi:glycosidase